MQDRIIIIAIAFVLDLLIGDPAWLWHPVRGIGWLIAHVDKLLCKIFRLGNERESDKFKKLTSGVILVIAVVTISLSVQALILYAAWRIDPLLRTIVECIMCYQMLAMKSLMGESMKVYRALRDKDVGMARNAVSMIVGRDTASLDEQGIVRAAVETVAENTSDGVVAPMIYMVMFGALGGCFYKAVNTLDSMVGYKNDRYIYLGRAAAKLDDILNFIPSRVSAIFMLIAAFIIKLDVKAAWRIFKRDRFNHASPNSAQTEAICAGALSVQLAGDTYYFGELYKKPTIGDGIRDIETEDIKRVNRLMYGTAVVTFAVAELTLIAVMILLSMG